MPRNIDSDALTLVQRQLGLSGIGESATELLSDELLQVMEVTPAIRRSRADLATGGWWFATLENVHAAADTEVSNIDPYEAGDAALGTFPAAINNRFDLWVEGVAVRREAGGGAILTAGLVILLPARFQGIGVDDAGNPTAASAEAFPLGFWNNSQNMVNSSYGRNLQSGLIFQHVGVRMPRGGTLLQFESQSTAAVTLRMFVLLGLFPVGMGSDVAK